MKHILYLTVLLMSTLVYAQTTNPEEDAPIPEGVRAHRGVELYMTQYFAFSNAAGLNNRLLETQYPPLGGLQIFWGGGIQYRIKRLQLGLEFTHTINPFGPRREDTAMTRRSAYTIQLYAYYTIYQGRLVRWYPFLGLGGMETSVTLTRKIPDADFSQLLDRPGNAISLTHFQGFLNIGMGADITDEHKKSGMMVSYRVGYRIGDLSQWFSDYTPLRNPPFDRLSNFYIQFNIGYTWNRLSKRQRILQRMGHL